MEKPPILRDKEIEKVADNACDKAEEECKCGTGDSCMDCRLRETAVVYAQRDADVEWYAAQIREIFEEMARHESCDKWGNPTISIGYRDSHQGKIYDDWFLFLQDKYSKQSIGR